MIAQFGFFALVIALALAIIQTVFPLLGAQKGIANFVQLARPVARLQFAFVLLSFLTLVFLFLTNDFSVRYVYMNSSVILPWYYRITATWGSHEGSLLLWTLILSLWTLAVSIYSRHLPEEFIARVLSVMGFISVGFIIFVLALSNPFAPLQHETGNQLLRLMEGRGLNPLLQDFGMIIHPPMLYMGYVGFCVAFSFAVAALIEGRLDALWARWSRPWTNIAWMFLTLGIMLGSWWAYYELGWGGWWFWDQVENASFMPWLVGTALIHSLAVTEKRGAFQTWTLMLAIITFSLSLLGTFLVRSGITTSVHAFASDPARGIAILIFLVLVVGIPLMLYNKRAESIKSTGFFATFSRESFILVNNVVFVVVCTCVLIGTVYPIIYPLIFTGSLSMGKPYFNLVFLIFMIPLCLITVVAPQVKWKKDDPKSIFKDLRWPAVISVVVMGLSYALLKSDPVSLTEPWYIPGTRLLVALCMGLIAWMTINGLEPVFYRIKKKGSVLAGLKSLTLASWGMTVAHLGVVVFIVGVTFVSFYNHYEDVAVKVGQSYKLAGYDFKLNDVKWKAGPNYNAFAADVGVFKNQRQIATIQSQKRYYIRQRNIMTEAGINPGFTRDLMVTMSDPHNRNFLGVLQTPHSQLNAGVVQSINKTARSQAWTLRFQYKPMVRWIWLGAILMAFGGLLAASDRRYRKVKLDSAVAV